MDKVFAPGIPRDPETGWLLFPRDTRDRKELFFPSGVKDHPAKMNFHLQQACIDFVALPGDILLDPFGGTGTLLIATLQGMRVILLEIEEGYHQLEQQAVDNLRGGDPEAADRVLLLYGDNRLLMPIPCNHIITSPPYASMLHQRTIREGAEDDAFVKMDKQINAYSKSMQNIGALNNFFYNQEMEKVYKLCYRSLPIGGTLTIILKDRLENNKRVSLTGWAARVCTKYGFTEIYHDKWKTPGMQMSQINKMHGLAVIEDESILVFQK